MSEERTLKNVFKNTQEEKGSVGNTRKRWLDGVGNNVKKMGDRGWRKIVEGRDAWKLILKKTRGPARILQPVEKGNSTYVILVVVVVVVVMVVCMYVFLQHCTLILNSKFIWPKRHV
jgi:hypothetical protein